MSDSRRFGVRGGADRGVGRRHVGAIRGRGTVLCGIEIDRVRGCLAPRDTCTLHAAENIARSISRFIYAMANDAIFRRRRRSA